MTQPLTDLIRAITATSVHEFARYWLEQPAVTPIVQTVHLLSVATIMGSIVLIDLRVLGLALPSQPATELVRRLMPWTWCAMPVLAASGVTFIFGRPSRYLLNPVFGIKLATLASALILAVTFQRPTVNDPRFWEQSRGRRATAKLVAATSLVLWLGVAMAGRWIAYVEYLFPESE